MCEKSVTSWLNAHGTEYKVTIYDEFKVEMIIKDVYNMLESVWIKFISFKYTCGLFFQMLAFSLENVPTGNEIESTLRVHYTESTAPSQKNPSNPESRCPEYYLSEIRS